MPLALLAVIVGLVRRIRPVSVAFALYETWRRLPPEHRQRIALAARRNAPRVAATIVRRGRPRT
ncbi:MAG TPA: hypothetical protein VLA22_11055 [Gaiellaceae bacterium]|nr:hypothetical protein [Gaiellaceae bacterium]